MHPTVKAGKLIAASRPSFKYATLCGVSIDAIARKKHTELVMGGEDAPVDTFWGEAPWTGSFYT